MVVRRKMSLNWTKVGLKGVRVAGGHRRRPGLNWTKVGLKGGRSPAPPGAAVCLNWTKVGLKATTAGGMTQTRPSFELD